MTKPDRPAFPTDWVDEYPGLTKREYAAIHLSVPDSGEEWLDEMIRKANRQKHAKAALQGMLAGFPDEKAFHPDYVATSVVRVADALIAELAEGEKP